MNENLSVEKTLETRAKAPKKPKVILKKHNIVFLIFLGIVIFAFAAAPYYYPETFSAATDKVSGAIMGSSHTAPVTPADMPASDNAEPPESLISLNLSERLNNIEDRLSEISSADSPATIQAVAEKVVALENRLEEISGENDKLLTARIDALEQKISTLSVGNEHLGMLVLGLLQLKETALTGMPFGKELNAVTVLADNNPALVGKIKELVPFAYGLTPQPLLRSEFAAAVKEAFQKSASPDSGENWSSALADKLKGLIVIRKVEGESSSISSDLIIAKAEKLVSQDKLKEASAELLNLPENILTVFKPWQDKVYVWERVNRIINDVMREALFPASSVPAVVNQGGFVIKPAPDVSLESPVGQEQL